MNDGIFVSYSHNDSAAVEKIVAVLEEVSGNEVWFDYKLRGGENYFSVIANKIVENKYFVFVVSKSSVESEWCMRELEFAASEKRRIIAIWLEDINIAPRIKLIIQNTHYINRYSATDAIFRDTVATVFSGSASAPSPRVERDNDELLPKNQKYFLTKEEHRRIRELLQAEKEGKFSVCFSPENANLLGIAYESGISTEADKKKASLYYKASRYAGNLDGKYLYAALKQDTEPENREHLSEMLEAAEQGSVLGLTHVGDNYYFGSLGLPVDLSKAYEYFERAARANGALALYYTAYGYRKGEGVPQDHELAYMFALRAKEKEVPRAYRILAFMYESGDFVDKDLNKAVEMYGEAIKRGDYLSYCYMGYVCGLLGDTAKKVELYKKAAELAQTGEIKSGLPFYRMAILYDDGIGVSCDYETATEYYLKAAKRSHKNAKKWAVSCIKKLEGDKKLSYLQKAYELNCKDAAYELGRIEKSKRKSDNEQLSEAAVSYFENGAESGDIYCVLELLWNYSYVLGNGVFRKDREQSIKWFRFFFANADEDFLNSYRESNILASYYYAYAVELDYDPDVTPDREFVLYNFKKSVEECPKHLGNIIHFTVNGYLFPDESSSGLQVDIPHTEEILAFVQEHLTEFFEYLKKEDADNYADYSKKASELMKKGYTFISKCYKEGKIVPKNKEKSEKYRQLAASV